LKLNAVVAIAKTRMAAHQHRADAIYHKLQKHQLAGGNQGKYTPATDQDIQQPPELRKVQLNATELLAEYAEVLTPAWDIAATRDYGNCEATASVLVDGTVLLPDVPVTYLLWLETQLTYLRTVIDSAPVLDPAENWEEIPGSAGLYQTRPVHSERTKKITDQVVVIPPGTHPGQWTEISKDVKAGTWERVQYHGGLTPDRKKLLLSRVEKLRDAVKIARDEANSLQVPDVKTGEVLFSYLLAE
jgi:hypothetical protein